MIDIKNIPDSTLIAVIKDGSQVSWDFLALQVMISRFKLKLSLVTGKDNDEHREEMMKQYCAEMRELFVRNQHIPNAKKDMQVIVERFSKRLT